MILLADVLAAIGALCLLTTVSIIFAVWLSWRRDEMAARDRAAERADWSQDRRQL